MIKSIRQLFGGAALAGAALLPQAQAGSVSTVIDFEGAALVGLYMPGDPDFGSFKQSGFVLAPDFDFGTVDTVLGLSPLVAPTGNSTQFYFNSNDGGLLLAREDGRSFNLDGFSAAFVPQLGAAQNIVIVAYGLFSDLTQGGMYFGLGDTTSGATHPFGLYNNPADFSHFTDLLQLEFFACVLDTAVCGTASRDNAQFAIDEIQLSTVPEPGTLALMALGLLGLLGLGRRNRRHTI